MLFCILSTGIRGAALEGARVAPGPNLLGFAGGEESVGVSDWAFPPADVPVESLRLRFALLQSLNTTLETFFLPLVELRQSDMYGNSIAALLQEAKGQRGRGH